MTDMSNPNERAVFVAAMRELADLVEGDESLPVPFHSRLQSGFYSAREDGAARTLTRAEKIARLRGFAERLGVDVIEDSGGGRTATLRVGPIAYFAHVNAEQPGERAGTRVVPADEDAALTGGAR